MTKPITEYEADKAERLAPTIREAIATREVLESRAKQLQSQAAKESDPCERKTLVAEVIAVRKEAADIGLPVVPQVICDDCTPERLVGLLQEQGGRIALMSAEGGVYGLMAGRYSATGPNLDVYLKGHAGDNIRVDRINRPPEYVADPALTMGLTVQPSILHGMTNVPEFRGRGLVARAFYCIPKNLLGHRDVEPPAIPEDIDNAYYHQVQELLNAHEGDECQLSLSEGARTVWLDFCREIEPRLGEEGDLGAMDDWAGKLCGAVGRIAGLLHIAGRCGSETAIGEDTMAHAVAIGRYLIPHAQAAFAMMGADPNIEAARRVWAWIERSGKMELKERDIFEGVKGRLPTVDELRPALGLLEHHGYIRKRSTTHRQGRGRRPSPVYDVNPKAKIDSHNSHKSESSNSANSANGSGGSNGRPEGDPGSSATPPQTDPETDYEEFVL